MIALVLVSLAVFTCQSLATNSGGGGHIAYTLTKEYLESFQDLFWRFFIKEIDEMQLRDVRVQ